MGSEPIWWSVGGLTGLIGATLLLSALFSDRPRGRRRCPRCWYDLGGVPGLRCPECGTDARSERRLLRTRRHWLWAALGSILLLAGGAGVAFPVVSADGALSILPTSALLVLAPPAGSGRSFDVTTSSLVVNPIVEELERRHAQESLSGRQWAWYLRNKGAVQLPDRWPAGVPLVIRMRSPEWTDYTEVWLSEREGDPFVARVGTTEWWMCGNAVPEYAYDGFRELPITLEESGPLCLSATLVTGAGAGGLRHSFGAPTRELWRGPLHWTVRVVETPRDMFRIAEGATWDERMRAILAPEIVARITPRGTWLFYHLSLDREQERTARDLAIGFEVQLRHDGVVQASGFVGDLDREPLWLAGSHQKLGGRFERASTPMANEIARDPAPWSLRVIGRPDLAIRDFEREIAWDGAFELPLAAILTVEHAD